MTKSKKKGNEGKSDDGESPSNENRRSERLSARHGDAPGQDSTVAGDDSVGSLAGQPTIIENNTESFSFEIDPVQTKAIKDQIKEVISEPLLDKLVTLLADTIMERVTQKVYAALKIDITAKETEINTLKKKVKNLEKSFSAVDKIQEEQEQYSRRESLRLYGIPETPNEKTDEVVREFVKERLNIELSRSDIARSHRITPKPRPGSTVRNENHKPIIVKFNTYNTRQAVFDAKSRLRGTKIFIQEDLTSHRRELLNAARQKSTVKRVWTNDGKITVLVCVPGSHDRKVTIRSKSDIERLE